MMFARQQPVPITDQGRFLGELGAYMFEIAASVRLKPGRDSCLVLLPQLRKSRSPIDTSNAIGRSRGGPTTKLHALVDGLGRLVAFVITPGQRGDAPVAADLILAAPASVTLAADRAYDSDALRRLLLDRGTQPVIPNGPRRKRLHDFDPEAYQRRNLVERAFCRIKDFRRVATRYDKLACTYPAAIALAAIVAWWL